MKNKFLLSTSLLLTIVLAILVIPMVSAANTLDSPVIYGNYSTTMNVSLSMDANGAATNMSNVTCWFNASGGKITEKNSTTVFVEIINTSKTQLIFEQAVTISGYAEVLAGYNISCDIYNVTEANKTVSAGSITIDYTSPLCSLNGDHSLIPYKGTILLTWTSSDAFSALTTAVTIDGPQDQTTITDTDANDERTLSSQETKYFGDWEVTILATDQAANTCTAYYNFSSYLPDGVDWLEPGESKIPKDTGKIVFGLIIVGVIVYFAFIKKK